jgi:casein kinase 1/casein kinase 1 epsilon
VKNEKGKFLVLEVLGPDLETLFQKCGRKFSLSTTTLIALRMLELLEYVHSFSYSYIDVKPENFLFGRGVNNRRLYLVDFGLTKKFIDEEGNHIPFNENNKWVIGTINYVSVYNHYGIESSRRDDLIALGYLLARFLKGTLPWEDHKPPASYSPRAKKINVELELLRRKLREIYEKVFFADLPEEYIKFMDYGEELGYGNAPDYAYLKTLFCSLLKREKIQENDPFDWDHLK